MSHVNLGPHDPPLTFLAGTPETRRSLPVNTRLQALCDEVGVLQDVLTTLYIALESTGFDPKDRPYLAGHAAHTRAITARLYEEASDVADALRTQAAIVVVERDPSDERE